MSEVSFVLQTQVGPGEGTFLFEIADLFIEDKRRKKLKYGGSCVSFNLAKASKRLKE